MARARCPCGNLCEVEHVAPGERFQCPACGKKLVRPARKEKAAARPTPSPADPNSTSTSTFTAGVADSRISRDAPPTDVPRREEDGVRGDDQGPPLLVGGYQVVDRLKAGGMGIVYEAIQLSLNRKVALKVLSSKVAKKPTAAERFRRETQILVALRHPHIVAILDCGDHKGTPYYVMEYVDGPRGDGRPLTLSDVIQEGGISAEQARAYAIQVGEALAFAHARSIIHRDVKPSNVLIDQHGKAQVLDFGIASFKDMQDFDTGERTPMGTADFMAPEQGVDAGKVDGRADVYSLGVVLYLLLTRKLPKGAFDPPCRAVPGLDPRWDDVVMTALRNDRDDRYPTMEAFVAALRMIGESGGTGTGSGTTLGRGRRILEIPEELPRNPVAAREVLESLRKAVSHAEATAKTQAVALGEALLSRTEGAPKPPASFVKALQEVKEIRRRLVGNQVVNREIQQLSEKLGDVEQRLERYGKDLRDLQQEIAQQWAPIAERGYKLQREHELTEFDEVFKPLYDFEAALQALEDRINQVILESEKAGFLGKMAAQAKKLKLMAELELKKMGRNAPVEEVGKRVFASTFSRKVADGILDRALRLAHERDGGRTRLEKMLERLTKERDDCLANLRSHGVTARSQERIKDLLRETAEMQSQVDNLFAGAAAEVLDRKAQFAANDPVVQGLTEGARLARQTLEKLQLQLRTFEGQARADSDARA